MKKTSRCLGTILAAMAAMGGVSQASVILEEGFEYAAGTLNSTQNGGTGFTNGSSWGTSGDAIVTGLHRMGLVSAGSGALKSSGYGSNPRTVATPFGGSTFYMSMVINANNTNTARFGFELMNTGGPLFGRVNGGWGMFAGPNGKLGISNTLGNYQTWAGVPAAPDAIDHLIVVKLDYQANAIKLWVDPVPAVTEPVPSATLVTGGNWTVNLNSQQWTGVRLFHEAANQTADELRVGTTWGDVVPKGPELWVQEGFNYATATTVGDGTQNGGIGFASTPGWSVATGGGANDISIISAGLAYRGLVSAGSGAIKSVGWAGNSRSTPWPYGGGNFYLSMLVNANSTETGRFGFELSNAGGPLFGRVNGGWGMFAGPNGKLGISNTLGNYQTWTGVAAPADSANHLLVYGFDYDTDTIRLWVDPVAGAAMPPPSATLASGGNWTVNLTPATFWNSVRLFHQNSNQIADELRIGSTWDAVVPFSVPSYAEWAAGFGLNPLTDGSPNADPDHDGYTNFEENEYGTDPTVRGGVPGSLLLETWNNLAGSTVEHLTWSSRFAGAPDTSEFVFSAETPANRADNFGARMRGFIIASETGSYTFHIAGDDSCQLWLSPSENQFTKQKIASVDGWTNVQEWTKYSSQSSAAITLQAGQKVYIEALLKESAGNDHLEIGWKTPGSSTIAVIPGSALESYAYDANDADGDNIPDDWESANGLNPTLNDAALDDDNDGVPNHLEYTAATDPQSQSTISGALVQELWLGIPGYHVKELTASPKFLQQPDFRSLVGSTQTFPQPYDAFGSRLRGYLTAPATGTYTFWVMGDDETELWLSTSASKFDKQMLVRPTLNTGNFDTDLSQKSPAVSLAAGQTYYLEILHKDNLSTDFCQVAWQKPGGTREIIPGSALSTFIPTADDQDDDDLPDAWELANGLSPHDNGRINPKNGAHGDLDGDGLDNSAEFKAGTRADLADTDGDGVNDRDEVEMMETQALTADVAPFESITTIPGATYSATSGSWIQQGGKAKQDCVRGWLEYPVTLATAGVYQLDLAFTPVADAGVSPDYEIVFSADGKTIQRETVTVAEAASGHAKVLSPWLTAGIHTIRVFIDNSYYFRRVTVDQLEVLAARGPDANSNGTPDWIDLRLAKYNSIEAPSDSLTSPVCLEGKAKWSELTTITGGTVQPAPNDRWYADVPLDATQPTAITASLENGGLTATRQVNWLPTNLLATGTLSIRQGDSLKLSAFIGTTGTPEETVSITVEGQTTTITADQCLVHTFTTAGNIPVQVTHSLEGNLTTATATINVVAAPIMESPVCVVGHFREVSIPVLPNGVTLQLDNSIEIIGSTTYPAGSQLRILRLNTLEDRPSVFRLGGTTGPILASLPVRAVRIRYGDDTSYRYVGSFGAASYVIETPVIVDGVGSARLEFEIFIGGVTFDDGSLGKLIEIPSDLNAFGEYLLHFYKIGDSGSICHRLKIFQGGVRIAYYQ